MTFGFNYLDSIVETILEEQLIFFRFKREKEPKIPQNLKELMSLH